MLPDVFRRLLVAAAGLRGADQLMLAGTPLIVATAFDGGPDLVGLIVAVQGSAWLLISLPAGVAVDRTSPLDALRRGMAIGLAGVVLAMAGLASGSLPLFAFGGFVSASAAVVGLLSESAAVQEMAPGHALPLANARLQLVQSGAMLLGPALMGYAVLRDAAMAGYALALLFAALALLAARGFGQQPFRTAKPRRPLAEITEGFAFVRGQPLLLGIMACALFWNLAFFALAALFIPFALGPIGLNSAEAGLAQAAMGIGSLLAAVTAAPIMRRLSPRAVLFFGPASSTLAAILVSAAPAASGPALPALAYLLLGFGPILWFVCQNSIRQLVTPPGLLGRVGSVIQVAIYGVRSFGAILGGLLATHAGFETALLAVIALFACSTASVLLSALGGLARMPASAA